MHTIGETLAGSFSNMLIMWISELPILSSSTRLVVSLLNSPVPIYVSMNPEMDHQLVIFLFLVSSFLLPNFLMISNHLLKH